MLEKTVSIIFLLDFIETFILKKEEREKDRLQNIFYDCLLIKISC